MKNEHMQVFPSVFFFLNTERFLQTYLKGKVISADLAWLFSLIFCLKEE